MVDGVVDELEPRARALVGVVGVEGLVGVVVEDIVDDSREPIVRSGHLDAGAVAEDDVAVEEHRLAVAVPVDAGAGVAKDAVVTDLAVVGVDARGIEEDGVVADDRVAAHKPDARGIVPGGHVVERLDSVLHVEAFHVVVVDEVGVYARPGRSVAVVDVDPAIVVPGLVVVHLRLDGGDADARLVVVGEVAAGDELVGRVDGDAGAELGADGEGDVPLHRHPVTAEVEAGVLIGGGVAGGAVRLVAGDDRVGDVGLDVEAPEGVIECRRVGDHQPVGVEGDESLLAAGEGDVPDRDISRRHDLDHIPPGARVVSLEQGGVSVGGAEDLDPRVRRQDSDVGRQLVRAGVHVGGVAGVEVVDVQERVERRHGVGGRRAGVVVVAGCRGVLIGRGIVGVVDIVEIAGHADGEHGVGRVEDRGVGGGGDLQRAPIGHDGRLPGEGPVVGLVLGDWRERCATVRAEVDGDERPGPAGAPADESGFVLADLLAAREREELDEGCGRMGRLRRVALEAQVDPAAVGAGLDGVGRRHIAGVDGGRVEGVGLPEPAVMAGDRGGQVEVVVRARRGGGGVVPQHEVGGRHPSRARGGRLLRPEQPARPIRRRPLQARRRDVTVVHHLELEGHPARRRRRVHRPPLRGEVHDGHGRQRRDQIVHVQLLRPVRAEVEGVVPCLGQVDLPAPAEGRAVVGQSPEPAVVHEVHHAVHDPRDRGGAAPRLVREALEAEPAELLEPPHPVRPGLGHEPRVRCQRVLIEPQLVPPVGQRPELLLPEAQLGPVGEVEVVVVAGEADLGGVGHVEGVVPRPAGP